MANMMQTLAGVRGCGKADHSPRDRAKQQRGDALRPAKGLLAAAGIAAAMWAAIGLLVWWAIG